ncbi:MAG: polysaccharide biosynthesis/export family protein [Alistipes sp.]|nr:polysaccharide biosynthesis/export family protein [Alistipes sp.]MBP3550395.1 polysaccharide biosynthesis/export family protein [Alistipes sp.]
MKRFLKTLTIVALAIALAGCNASKRIVYNFNKDEAIKSIVGDGQIRIKPHDRLQILVSSQNSELAAPFNSSSSFNALSQNPLGVSSANGIQSVQVLTVDENGMLEMPIIGKVSCAGKTRQELAADIAKRIIDGGYVNDAKVNIQFADMKIYVLGEVTRPGQFDITRDKITVLEALAMAGDMTIYGNRANVAVIRSNGKEYEVHELNFLEGGQMSSPAFYLQQGDVVYVQPNKYKAATSEINQNRNFWLSIVGSLISASSLVLTILNYTTNLKLLNNNK